VSVPFALSLGAPAPDVVATTGAAGRSGRVTNDPTPLVHDLTERRRAGSRRARPVAPPRPRLAAVVVAPEKSHAS
jgi:hypothetical protein